MEKIHEMSIDDLIKWLEVLRDSDNPPVVDLVDIRATGIRENPVLSVGTCVPPMLVNLGGYECEIRISVPNNRTLLEAIQQEFDDQQRKKFDDEEKKYCRTF